MPTERALVVVMRLMSLSINLTILPGVTERAGAGGSGAGGSAGAGGSGAGGSEAGGSGAGGSGAGAGGSGAGAGSGEGARLRCLYLSLCF